MSETPKKFRNKLRELNLKAYSHELNQELAKLAAFVDEWRAQRADCFELENKIHQFHNDAARDLFKLYGMVKFPNIEYAVSRAIVNWILDKSSVDAGLLKYLERHLRFSEDQKTQSSNEGK